MQNTAHRLMLGDKSSRRAAVCADEAVVSWNTSSASTFVVHFHALEQKPTHAHAQFVCAAGSANKLSVELELSPSAQFGKHPLLLRMKCSYQAAVSPMVLVLGAVLVTFTKDKDFKAKKPASSSYMILLVRSTVNASSRSFLSLPGQIPPSIHVEPIPSQSATSSSSSAPNSARALSTSLPGLGTASPTHGSASQSNSPRTARANESGGMQNPILSLVHLNKRELTRKCELDNSLTFQSLVHALVKFPDREEDLEAYIGTMPMWSSAKDVKAEKKDVCFWWLKTGFAR